VDLAFKFEDPNILGLNTGKSDYVMFFVNQSYPWSDIFTEEDQLTGEELLKPLQTRARARIELTIDYHNPVMEKVISFSYFIMIGFAGFLFL